MSAFLDLTGQNFTRWTVLSRVPDSRTGITRWLCRCVCGTEQIVFRTALRNGHSRSCGCLKNETTCKRSTRHNHAHRRKASPTYRTWCDMHKRCTNPRSKNYSDYGGRGIRVCPRWHDFTLFLADMGERPAGRSLDRHPDRDGNYEKSNCRWATGTEQARNTRANHRITFNGETRCLAEWAEVLGIKRTILKDRLRAGWSVERALTTPPR